MENKTDPAKQLFKMMAFQYEPLEKRFLEECKKTNNVEIAKKYISGSYTIKIRILDKFASYLGLN